MANRAYLIESSEEDPVHRAGPPAKALAAGKNCIPVYWCSLFDTQCIRSNRATLLGGRSGVYSYLVTSSTQARARALQRQRWLEQVTPASHPAMMEQWFGFLNRIELPFIHLDAMEIWAMLEASEFDRYLQICLGAFERPAEAPSKNELWLEMLDTAGIDANDLAGTVRGWKLAGHSWGTSRLSWEAEPEGTSPGPV